VAVLVSVVVAVVEGDVVAVDVAVVEGVVVEVVEPVDVTVEVSEVV
jgi:hypothetical protein